MVVALSIASLSCGGPSAAGDNAPGALPDVRQGAKRIVFIVKGEPALLTSDIGQFGGGVVPGTGTVLDFIHTGLTERDPQGNRVPRLATTLPTIENGLWLVLPDGRMETTWRLNSAARWHDGSPFTSDDLLFTAQVKRDRDMPFIDIAFDYIESAAAPDGHTVTVRWNRTFLEADGLFATIMGPIPKHLLEKSYLDDKAKLMELPYWNEGFVGTGPFKMKEWVRGSHYLLVANDDYILGRPRLDEVEIRFITDAPVIVANLLAGAADITIGALQVPLDVALDMKERWPEGTIAVYPDREWYLFPQFINSNPAIIGASAQFRRALYHALDRQTMGETFNGGLPTQVEHGQVGPNEPGFAEIEAALPKYDYDPRRSQAMLTGLGHQKGQDGLYRDGAGEPLKLEVRSTTNVDPRIAATIVDQWQRLGMLSEQVIIPPQRMPDREYRATFPGFVYTGSGVNNQLGRLRASHSRETPLPENNFNGNNTSRWRNPGFDALVDRVVNTIPIQERTALAGEAHRIMMEDVGVMTLWYGIVPGIILRSSIQNVLPPNPNGYLWRVHEWDLAR